MEKVELKTPITWEDESIKELNLDLDGLTGNDLIEAEREFMAAGGVAKVAEFSKAYLACVASKAAKVPAGVIGKLCAKDFTKVTMTVQDFFFS